MTIELASSFLKSYKKRIRHNSKLDHQYAKRIEIFRTNPDNPLLHDHSLVGSKLGLRAFSINGDIRVIYSRQEDTFLFYDIGTHNQVYR